MSLKFDFVINCDLREDTSRQDIEVIQCLTQRDYILSFTPDLQYPKLGNIWDMFGNKHFLAPDPDNGIISNFRRFLRHSLPGENGRDVYHYRLQYCGNYIHDDEWAHHHLPFACWLATIAMDGFMGYYADTTNTYTVIQELISKNRLLQEW